MGKGSEEMEEKRPGSKLLQQCKGGLNEDEIESGVGEIGEDSNCDCFPFRPRCSLLCLTFSLTNITNASSGIL